MVHFHIPKHEYCITSNLSLMLVSVPMFRKMPPVLLKYYGTYKKFPPVKWAIIQMLVVFWCQKKAQCLLGVLFGADLNYWTRDGFSCAGLRRSLPPSRHKANTLTSLALRQVPIISHSLHHPTQSAVLLQISFVLIICSAPNNSIDIVILTLIFWLVTSGLLL